METDKFKVYIDFLENQGKSKNTIDAYKRDLVKFSTFLENEEIEIEKFEELEIVSYTEFLMDSGISKSSIIRNLVTLRNFYKFLRRQGFVLEAPILYYELPHLDKTVPEILTVEEINLIMDAPLKKTNKGKRDRAMLELLYASGVKVTELINLKVNDINLDKLYIYCRSDKKKERLIPIGSTASNCLKEYLEIRNEIANDESDFLFTSNKGETITRQGIWKMLKSYLEMANIEKDVNLNTLRHSFAVHLLDNGADIKAVQEMLGHTDVNITLKYKELNKQNKLMQIYKDAHPRA